MRRIILFLAVAILVSGRVLAQYNIPDLPANKKDHFAVGMSVNNFGNDFGVGINLTSPSFFVNHMAVRASGNYQLLNHLDSKGEQTRTGYGLIKVGVAGLNMSLSNAIMVYGEGGLGIALTDNTLSARSASVGGYGLFGFEFLMPANISFFIELGSMGIGARADNVATSPLIATGFLTSTGFRVRL